MVFLRFTIKACSKTGHQDIFQLQKGRPCPQDSTCKIRLNWLQISQIFWRHILGSSPQQRNRASDGQQSPEERLRGSSRWGRRCQRWGGARKGRSGRAGEGLAALRIILLRLVFCWTCFKVILFILCNVQCTTHLRRLFQHNNLDQSMYLWSKYPT